MATTVSLFYIFTPFQAVHKLIILLQITSPLPTRTLYTAVSPESPLTIARVPISNFRVINYRSINLTANIW
jgi:hypothetical protein